MLTILPGASSSAAQGHREARSSWHKETDAWMGGMRGAMLMQTSGFATLANVLASLVVPSQIPLIMFVSERGTLGEFNGLGVRQPL